MTTPTYLGDGLYVTHDGYQVELYAHNGLEKTNSVYLAPAEIQSFLNYLKKIGLHDAPTS
ncbi:hypothetical protein A5772_21535 [Mycolicibacter sinensis]|uniref:Uncharacterized protein n=1 Tax=Mycolicibacter sinensis (strain JDM601) TaxID=875328 RepID=A0A1A2EYT8_MYCSD|nr:hypothetical protein A5772_21535 [Mycolicibacter sinensis]OBG09370.1 hypothetical protein A5771_01570 [Mycolicibacter sinensis]